MQLEIYKPVDIYACTKTFICFLFCLGMQNILPNGQKAVLIARKQEKLDFAAVTRN